jgi:hypothetical protein
MTLTFDHQIMKSGLIPKNERLDFRVFQFWMLENGFAAQSVSFLFHSTHLLSILPLIWAKTG